MKRCAGDASTPGFAGAKNHGLSLDRSHQPYEAVVLFMAETSDTIMLSALEHYSYCPRQYALIHIEQAFDHNVHTKRGDAVHDFISYERITA